MSDDDVMRAIYRNVPRPESLDEDNNPKPSFTCPRCRKTSYNPNDVREGYCGACHDWTGQPASTGGSDY